MSLLLLEVCCQEVAALCQTEHLPALDLEITRGSWHLVQATLITQALAKVDILRLPRLQPGELCLYQAHIANLLLHQRYENHHLVLLLLHDL